MSALQARRRPTTQSLEPLSGPAGALTCSIDNALDFVETDQTEPLAIMTLLVPDELNRNAPQVHAAGPENTGSAIMSLVAEYLNLPDLSGCNILDVGCGVRFTQAIINRSLPIGTYTGIDANKELIEFLRANVADPRFTFVWWNVHNDQYNPTGEAMQSYASLPISGEFDIIWLFSVFTHLIPEDALTLLKIMRRHVHQHSSLIFTAFIVDNISTFENRTPLPEIYACYNERYIRSLITEAGWSVQSLSPPNFERYVQHLFVCRPA